MAKIAEPYRCDACGALKEDSENLVWYLVFPRHEAHFLIPHERDTASDSTVIVYGALIVPWTQSLLTREAAAHIGVVKHACKLQCAVILATENLGALSTKS